MKKLFILLVLAFFVTGCASTYSPRFLHHYVSYDISLKEVERPSDAKNRYGEPKIDMPVKSQPADLHEKPVENVDLGNTLPNLLKRAQYCSFT